MSYDISMKQEVDGETVYVGESLNTTWNHAPIFYKALGDNNIHTLHGMTGAAALPFLSQAIRHIAMNREDYLPLEPRNGWGNLEAALQDLRDMRDMAANHPQAIFDIL